MKMVPASSGGQAMVSQNLGAGALAAVRGKCVTVVVRVRAPGATTGQPVRLSVTSVGTSSMMVVPGTGWTTVQLTHLVPEGASGVRVDLVGRDWGTGTEAVWWSDCRLVAGAWPYRVPAHGAVHLAQ
jgi:hypothetical protein